MDDFKTLKDYQRKHRDNWGKGINLRIHRALSWLNRAEQERERGDTDAEFIFLWIAFNAAYTSQHANDERFTERDTFDGFLQRIVGFDSDKALYQIIWQHYPSVIRSLMDNQYVFQPYWDCMNKPEPDNSWQESFSAAKRASHQALAEQNVSTSLSIVLSRLYTLRNQLMHGGATWNGQLNRTQLKDATNLLAHIVPIVLRLMMEHGTEHWGDATYFVED